EVATDVQNFFLHPFVAVVGSDDVGVGQVLPGLLDQDPDVICGNVDDELRVEDPHQSQPENGKRRQTGESRAQLSFQIAVFKEDVSRHRLYSRMKRVCRPYFSLSPLSKTDSGEGRVRPA